MQASKETGAMQSTIQQQMQRAMHPRLYDAVAMETPLMVSCYTPQ